MATLSSILICRIPWAKEPAELQSIQSQRVRCDWSDLACTHIHINQKESPMPPPPPPQITLYFSGPPEGKGCSSVQCYPSLSHLSFTQPNLTRHLASRSRSLGRRNSEKPAVWLGWLTSCNVTKYSWTFSQPQGLVVLKHFDNSRHPLLQVLADIYSLNTIDFSLLAGKIQILAGPR